MSLEKSFGRVEWQSDEREDLSDIVSVSFETDRTLSIHIERMDGDFAEKFDALRKGLSALAERLVGDPKYSNVRDIVAYSAIVTLYPEVIKSFGFALDEEDSPMRRTLARKYDAAQEEDPVDEKHRDIPPSYARISREEFLSRYTSK